MKLYIAGPMSNKQAYNYPAFKEAQMNWTFRGHFARTPFEATNIVWNRHYDRDFRIYTDTCEYGSPILEEMWVEDTKILLWADAIAILPEWETSRGSRLEVQIALVFGKQIYNAVTFEEMKLKVEVKFNEAE